MPTHSNAQHTTQPQPQRQEAAPRSAGPFLVPRPAELDHAAISERGGWQSLILAWIDWLAGRRCRCSLERQLAGDPCPHSDRQAGRAHFRSTNTPRALEVEDERCEFPRTTDVDATWRMYGALRAQRPGAEQPWTGCAGCVFSYPGSIDPDDGLVDAFTPTAVDRRRVAGLLAGAPVADVLPDEETRRKDVERDRWHRPARRSYGIKRQQSGPQTGPKTGRRRR